MKRLTEEEKKEFWLNRQPKLGKTFEESCKILKHWSINNQRIRNKYWKYCERRYMASISRAYECHRNGTVFEWDKPGLSFEEFIINYEQNENS